MEAQQSVTPVVDEVIGSVAKADSIFTSLAASIGSIFDGLGKSLQGVVAGISDLYDKTKDRSSAVATALGVAFGIFLAGTLAGAIYTVYKLLSETAGFVKGLFTGDSYRSQYIDDFLKINSSLKTFQKEMGASAEMASAWEDAIARSGKTSEELLGAQRDLEKAVNEANQAYLDNGMTLDALKTRQESITDAVKKFSPEIKKTEAIVVASYGRMADYGLLVTQAHQKAAEEYEASTRIFQRESELTARGFKQAISDTIMPILGDLAAFFQDGFPKAVAIFRGTVATLATLFHGLTTAIYTVAEGALALVEIIGRSFVAVALASAQALSGNFAGSMKTLNEGKLAIEARWTEMGDNIVARAARSRERIELAFGFKLSDGEKLFMPLAEGGKGVANKLQTDFKIASDDMLKSLESFYERSLALFKTNYDEAVAASQGTDNLTKSQRDLLRVMNDPLWSKIGEDQRKSILDQAKAARAKEDHNVATKNLFASTQALAEIDATVTAEIDAMRKAGDDNIISIGKGNELIEFQTSLLGKNTLERDLEHLALQKSIDLAKPENQWRRDEIEALYESRAALLTVKSAREQELSNQIGFWSQLSDLAGGFAESLMHGVGSAFDYLKKQARQLLLEMVSIFAKRWILSIGANMTTGAANAALTTAAGTTGQGTIAGALGSSASSYLFGNAANPGLILSSGGVEGLATEGALGAGGFAATIGTGVESIATSLGLFSGAAGTLAETVAYMVPIVGWIVAAGAILYSIFGHKGGGRKTGGSSLLGFDAAGGVTGDLTSTLDRRQYLHDETGQDSEAHRIAATFGPAVMQQIASLGGTSGGFQFGVGFNRDPAGTAPSMASSLLRDSSGRDLLVQSNRNVSRDDGALETEISLQMQRAMLVAVQSAADTMAPEVREIVTGLVASSATSEQITSVFKAAQEMKGVLEGLAQLGAKGLDVKALKGFQLAGESIGQTFQRIAGAFASFDDAFMSESQKLARAQTSVTDTFKELGIAIPKDSGAFYDLIHGLDLSTEAGRHTFEMLMKVAPAFQFVENSTKAMVAGMYSAAAGLSSSFGQSYAKANLNLAAQHWLDVSGSGKAGWTVDQVINEVGGIIAGGTASNPHGFDDALTFVQSLGPEAVAAFTDLLNKYKAFTSTTSQANTNLGSFVDNVGSASTAISNLAQQTADAKAGIADWLQGLFLDKNLSPLTPKEGLDFAQSNYVENLLKAQSNDPAALSSYTKFAQQYLEEAKSYYGPGVEFQKIFAGVTSQGAQLAGLSDARPVTAGDINNGFRSVVDELRGLRRDLGLQYADGKRTQTDIARTNTRAGRQAEEAARDRTTFRTLPFKVS